VRDYVTQTKPGEQELALYAQAKRRIEAEEVRFGVCGHQRTSWRSTVRDAEYSARGNAAMESITTSCTFWSVITASIASNRCHAPGALNTVSDHSVHRL
jgi:hypothetical protein